MSNSPGNGPARLTLGAGVVILAALLPLVGYPSLSGAGVGPFLGSFSLAGLAYAAAIWTLKREMPSLAVVWTLAVLFRLVMLATPVTLSEDVYRYLWDGHLMNLGINPYLEPVNSPLLDAYTTDLRARVNFPWMATPYLPAAQLYFGLLEWIAPQNVFVFQLAATTLDLAAGGWVMKCLKILGLPQQAVLIYLWNPLVVIEFAHGAHVDALLLFLMGTALWAWLKGGQSLNLSCLFLAGAVLVKGWPALAVPLFAARWGLKCSLLFGACLVLPLVVFASGAGWGLSGPLDGRGVFGALRIYAGAWEFNSGLYGVVRALLQGILAAAGWEETANAWATAGARLVAVVVPGLAALAWGAERWAQRLPDRRRPDEDGTIPPLRQAARRIALPFGLYLLLAPTVHPWYITLVLLLLPLCWPAAGEPEHLMRSGWLRWMWAWVYMTFFEGYTYLVYSGIPAPPQLPWIQLGAYLPFWALLFWAAAGRHTLHAPRPKLDLS